MNIKQVIAELYQHLGLRFINLLARSKKYQLSADISYGAHDRLKLDYYRIKGESKKPTIIFFYGGNWRSGDRQNYRFVADTLTSLGYNVIIPDYRLYPLVRFSEIQEDVIEATHWALREVPSDQPLIVMGHSAGAQLGALLCLNSSLLNTEYKANDRIKGFIGLAGPYDFYPFTEDDHWDLFGPASRYAETQAINYVRSDSPPLYLLHGETDIRVRRGNSKSLMEKAQAKGCRASREVYKNTGHVDIILGFTRFHRDKSPVIRDIVNFLEKL
ncbi:MAG: alpha/beta hydrolase [Pseudomonadales bacterium]|nr:alpha/beta hydrolase [Pseudomonadales bacterium]